MTEDRPIEPSAVYRADGSRVPDRRPHAPLPLAGRALLAAARGAAAGPLLTASALGLAAVVTARAAGVARTLLEQAVRDAVTPGKASPGQGAPRGWVEVSVTRVEVRWPL